MQVPTEITLSSMPPTAPEAVLQGRFVLWARKRQFPVTRALSALLARQSVRGVLQGMSPVGVAQQHVNFVEQVGTPHRQ